MAYKAQRGYQGESDARVSYAKNRISDKQKTKVCKKIEKKKQEKTTCVQKMQKIQNRMQKYAKN